MTIITMYLNFALQKEKVMFSTLPQSVTEFWKSFPVMGPNREYLEKIQNLQTSWMNFLQSNMEYNTLSQIFWQNFAKDFPNYVKKNFENFDIQKFDATKKLQDGLKFFDQCWEKTMQSEQYAQKSSDVLNNLGEFRSQLLELFTPILNDSNIASQQQIYELTKQMDELRKRIEQLEAAAV